ncbi:MAG: HNH endonuclease [Actinobacteria bacterium]|nr:HNH endonuclease [Actinomycetota bacterium]
MERELLEQLYWGNQLSQTEIGRLLSLPRTTIQKKMIKYNIERRDRNISNIGNSRCGWNIGLTKETDKRLELRSIKLKENWSRLSEKEKKSRLEPMLNTPHWNKGKTWEEDSRILHGEVHGFWKNNSTLNNYGKKGIRLKESHKEKIWRKTIYKKDNWTCQYCHNRSKKGHPIILNAHHIKSWKDFPEDRYKIENGITLCYDCHRYVHRIDILSQQ